MAFLDTTADQATEEVFALAEKLATSAADFRAIETEHTLEILYQARWARRRLNASSRVNSVELQQIAGWN